MSTIAPAGSTEAALFRADWQAWRHRRLAAASDPAGVASLVSTTWLGTDPQQVPGLVGHWQAEGATAVGTGLTGGGYTDADGGAVGGRAVLDASTTLHTGTRRVRIYVREGSPALRVFDAAGDGVLAIDGISAFAPDPDLVVPARFEPGGQPREIESIDGHRRVEAPHGRLHFELDGTERSLAVNAVPEGFSAVVGDETNGSETFRFRFLRVPAADVEGHTTIDFNRLFLPPCAFADAYLCPLPPPGNRLPVAIRAGERAVLRAGA